MPFLLSFYQWLSPFLQAGVKAYVRYRIKKGREDPLRIQERYGIASKARPDGAIIWFHGASVGEAVSLLPLLQRIQGQFPDVTPLVTTGTVTAAALMGKALPVGCIHQYCPLDIPAWVDVFLSHWRPRLAVFAESELWPNLIFGCKSHKIPLYMVNGDLSAKSCRSWQRFPSIIRYLLSCFEELLVQSETMAARLKKLGADPSRIRVCGNLKFSAAPLPCDRQELAGLQVFFRERPAWVAASTHSGEEEIIVHAHQTVKKTLPALLTVLIPRHPHRGAEIARGLRAKGLQVVQRSCQEPLSPSTDIYLIDTLGELGLFYRLSEVAFIGGTFGSTGGHNPIEPAILGCALIWGPQIHNFTDVCHILGRAGTAVKTREELATTVQVLLTDESLRKEKIQAGQAIVGRQSPVADHIVERLRKRLASVL